MSKLLIPELYVGSAYAGLDIRSWQQTDGYSCGYAAAVTLLRYFKIRARRREVWDDLKPDPDSGVTSASMARTLRGRGLIFSKKELTLENCRQAYSRELPVLVSARLDTQPRDEEHWMVLAGVREREVLLLNQPHFRYARVWWTFNKLLRRSYEQCCWVIKPRDR